MGRALANVILGLDPRIQTTTPLLDSSFRWNDIVGILDSSFRWNDIAGVLDSRWNDIAGVLDSRWSLPRTPIRGWNDACC